jgi:hypothetical protein
MHQSSPREASTITLSAPELIAACSAAVELSAEYPKSEAFTVRP